MLYRFLLAAANGLPMVCTPLQPSSRGPLVPEEHYLEAELDDLPRRIHALLDDEPERRALADRAHALATTELSLERSVARMLERVVPERAAAGS